MHDSFILNLLTLILGTIQLCDIIVSTALYYIYKKNRDYFCAIIIWVGMSLMFMTDNFLGKASLYHPYFSYVFAGVASIAMGELVARFYQIKYNWKYFLYYLLFTYSLSVIAFLLGIRNFTVLAFMVSWGVTTPILYASIEAFRSLKYKEKSQITNIDKGFLLITLIWGIHFLDYPFLRSLENLNFSIFGFSFALFLTYLTSVLIPVVVNRQIYLKLNYDLEGRLSAKSKELSKAQDQIMAREKLASIGELTAGIAHEIKNPLNIIKNANYIYQNFVEQNLERYIESIDHQNYSKLKDEIQMDKIKIKQTSDFIDKNVTRADRIIKNILIQSRTGNSELHETNVSDLLKESYQFIVDSISHKYNFNVNFVHELEERSFKVYSQELSRAFINIFENSYYALKSKKDQMETDFSPTIWIKSFSKDDEFVIYIKDNGIGISKENINKVLNPFFTTKSSGDGTGLGLAMVYDIVKSHQGNIFIDSVEKEFTEIKITISKNLN